MDPRAQRGFLNKNPGNMDRAQGEPWQGEIRDTVDARLTEFQRNELNHGRFAVFSTHELGIRAMVRNLRAYALSGWTTVDTMIDHWAPPIENNTRAYKANVCKSIGCTPQTFLNMSDYATAYAMVDAIIRVECGGMPYSGHEIEDGLRLAGVIKPATITESATVQGGAIAAGATMAQPVLAAVQDPIQNMVDTLSPLADMSAYVQYTMVALKVLLVAVTLYGVYMTFRERKARTERDVAIAAAHEAGL